MRTVLILSLFLVLNISLFANGYEFIDGKNITVNVNSVTEVEIEARGIYFITSFTGAPLKVKWPNTQNFQSVQKYVLNNPETTFEYGDKILLQAIDSTHNIFLGTIRRQ